MVVSKLKFSKIRSSDEMLNRVQDSISNGEVIVDQLNGVIVQPGTSTLTITNAPQEISGNPTGYIKITIGGVARIIPYW